MKGFAVFFGPRTLARTWGTRQVQFGPLGFCLIRRVLLLRNLVSLWLGASSWGRAAS